MRFFPRREVIPGEPDPNPRTPATSPARSADGSAVVVSVSFDLAEQATSLATALGNAFDVRVGPPQGPGVAVVSPHGTMAMAFYRLSHPKTALLVVNSGRIEAEQGPVEYLNAGADGYLSAVPTAVIAAHIQALARRQTLSSARPAGRPVAV